eukprot:COSAG04_NODE_10307_length_787_cov_1.770349_1_plen_80_part_00
MLEWRAPMAGPVAMPRLLLPGGAAAHCAAALATEGVMLIAEGEFKEAGDARVRLGLGREGMEGMLRAWGRALGAAAGSG